MKRKIIRQRFNCKEYFDGGYSKMQHFNMVCLLTLGRMLLKEKDNYDILNPYIEYKIDKLTRIEHRGGVILDILLDIKTKYKDYNSEIYLIVEGIKK